MRLTPYREWAQKSKRKIRRLISKLLTRVLLDALNTPEVEAQLWTSVHRPTVRQKAQDIQFYLYRQAAEEAAAYVRDHMPNDPCYDGNLELFEAALTQVKVKGLYLEFGVATGRTINFIAQHVAQAVHGFDSFEGLPENWIAGSGSGTFTRQGKPPAVRPNVQLHVGLFDQTLPAFAASHKEPIAFLHIDCDLYASTKIIFDALGDRIVPGTVIRFGEYFNYPGWRAHEYKAFQELVAQRKFSYRYLGYARRNYSVAVII